MNPLEEVMALEEAAVLWGKAPITVQQACKGYAKSKPRFLLTEARKAGRIWFVTRAGMERLYSPEPTMKS